MSSISSETDEFSPVNESGDKMEANESRETENDESGTSTDDDELQVAFKEGLLQKHGISIPQLKKKVTIYKKEEILQKLALFKKKQDWLNTLTVKFSPGLSYDESTDKDFNREAAFYKQAMNSVQIALPKLASMNVPTTRPSDYFAEMAKSDDQMDRVRRKLLEVQKRKERQGNARRLREERKFAAKVQRTREEKKRKEKKKLLDATKKHKKGMKGQLEDMLKNAKRMQSDADEEVTPSKFKRGGRQLGKRKMSRTARDKKFGFGGQKKRSKRNDRKSFDMM